MVVAHSRLSSFNSPRGFEILRAGVDSIEQQFAGYLPISRENSHQIPFV